MLLKEIYARELGLLSESRKSLDVARFKRMSVAEQSLYLLKNKDAIIGEGSSRKVFRVGSSYVLKWAKNHKGVAQNKAELEIYTDPKMKPLVARIYDFDSDRYNWIISEIARPVNEPSEWYELAGIKKTNDVDHGDVLDWVNNHFDYELDKTERGKKLLGLAKKLKWPHNKFIQNLYQARKHTKLSFDDLYFVDQWGKTPDGRLVVLDYGFTDDVKPLYYQNT